MLKLFFYPLQLAFFEGRLFISDVHPTQPAKRG
jgi:hypothetical protein